MRLPKTLKNLPLRIVMLFLYMIPFLLASASLSAMSDASLVLKSLELLNSLKAKKAKEVYGTPAMHELLDLHKKLTAYNSKNQRHRNPAIPTILDQLLARYNQIKQETDGKDTFEII